MTLEQQIAAFIRDAQFRLGELAVESNSMFDKNSLEYKAKLALRLKIKAFLYVLYPGENAIYGGIDYGYYGVGWTNQQIIDEIEYIRNIADISDVPWVPFQTYHPQILVKDLGDDHGMLQGLGDDDHPQYHNDGRGDFRYYTKAVSDSLFASISHTHDAADITSGTFADARISESAVTQHEGALTITESQISDLGSYATVGHTHTLSDITDSGELAALNLSEIPTTSSTFATSHLLIREVTSGNVEKIAASGGGTSNFLRADGTWAAPAGGGSFSVTNESDNRIITSLGAGLGGNAEANLTFNGSVLVVTGNVQANNVQSGTISSVGQISLSPAGLSNIAVKNRIVPFSDNNADLGTSSISFATAYINNIVLTEIAAPSTPSSGYGRIYFKTDGKPYALNDAGTEYDLSGNVIKVGTPANNQVGVWTGDGTIEGSSILSFDDNGVMILGNATTPPSTSPADAIQLYAEDVSASSELKVRDEAGNTTTLSPHNFSLIPEGASHDMAWAYFSEKNGKKINVDMFKLARLVEKLTNEKLIHLQ